MGGPRGGPPPTFPEIFVSPKVAYFSYLKSHKVSGLSEPPIKEHYVISRRGGQIYTKNVQKSNKFKVILNLTGVVQKRKSNTDLPGAMKRS